MKSVNVYDELKSYSYSPATVLFLTQLSIWCCNNLNDYYWSTGKVSRCESFNSFTKEPTELFSKNF